MDHAKICALLGACLWLANLQASWYWPFGGDSEDRPRLSTLMESASTLIGEASDLADDGKTSEAVEKYRLALQELDKVEAENPERARTREFDTLRTKRAYVSAAIDSLLLEQVRDNARPVAVSDTSALERRLAAEKEGKAEPAAQADEEATPEEATESKGPADEKVAEESEKPPQAKKPVAKKSKSPQAAKAPAPKRARARAAARPKQAKVLSRKERAMQAIGEGDYAAADKIIAEMLSEIPNDAAALNLRAVREMAEGKREDAERTLDRAIQSSPRSHYAYYNMAVLMLGDTPPNVDGARRYYETGRALGGPVDAELEAAIAK